MSHDLPKGPDDALVQGQKLKEASTAEAADMLTEAAQVSEPLDLAALCSPLAKLNEDSPPGEVLAALEAVSAEIVGLDPLKENVLQGDMIRHLRRIKYPRPTETAAAAMKKAQQERETDSDGPGGEKRKIDPTEPWDQAVQGTEILTEVQSVFEKYLSLRNGQAVALCLYCLLTYCLAAVYIAARLSITSPTKRCGKTTLLTILGALVEKPLQSSSISSAALYRATDKYSPTILIDEADTFLQEYEDLKGIINSGFGPKSSAVAYRCQGDDHDVTAFCTFGFVIIACIGKPPDTIHDRSIDIEMQRQKSKKADRLRLDRLELETKDLRRKMARWALDNMDAIRESDPDVPPSLHDRAADCWRPIFAIADLVGGDWPSLSREAAVSICQATDATRDEVGTMLLEDIQSIFETRRVDYIRSEILVEGLIEMKERPWREWKKGRPLTPRSLARLLKPFCIVSKNKRLDLEPDRVAKHYLKVDFEDSFDRYLADPVFRSATEPQANDSNGLSPANFRYGSESVADRKAAQTLQPSRCSVEAAPQGGKGGVRGKNGSTEAFEDFFEGLI